MTNGYAVYRDTKEHYKEATFQRRSPISEACSKFIMDELDIDAMIESVKVERLTMKVGSYLSIKIQIAFAIYLRSVIFF